MSDDDGLMVNFFKGPISSHKNRKKDKKLINKKNHITKPIDNAEIENYIIASKKDNVNLKRKCHDNTCIDKPREKRHRGNEIVSSLFKNNPVAPKVLKSESNLISVRKTFDRISFASLGIHKFIIDNLNENMGLTSMTHIQKVAIPEVLKGIDVLIKSETGSGKTLTYAIPILENLRNISPNITRADGVYSIIILPTRELALQTFLTFQNLVKSFIRIVPGLFVGGEKRKSEKANIRKGINIFITTPGRLIDHMTNTKSLCLEKLKHFVIDEADRLLELGFEKDISIILQKLKERHKDLNMQTILLSATLTSKVENIASMTLKDPIRVDVNETPHDKFIMPSSLKHYCLILPYKLRLVTLAAFLLEKVIYTKIQSKIIIFVSTKDLVDYLSSLFQQIFNKNGSDYNLKKEKTNIIFFGLHGDMPQNERSYVYKNFSKMSNGILICTDVGARGLDIQAVDWIIQYNPATSIENYIHRVGRSARAGAIGCALIFLAPSEIEYLKFLKDNINVQFDTLEMNDVLKCLLNNYQNTINRKSNMKIFRNDKYIEGAAINLQKQFEKALLKSEELKESAKRAFRSFLRSYAAYPSDLKHIFNMKSLHSGHAAKSFALNEAPKDIGATVIESHSSHSIEKKISTRNIKSINVFEEFESGLNKKEFSKSR